MKLFIVLLCCVAMVAALVVIDSGPAEAYIPSECAYARYSPWAALTCYLHWIADIWTYGGDGDGLSG